MIFLGGMAAAALALWVIAPIIWAAGSGAAGAGRCPACGPRPESGARFCSNCGAALEGEPSR